MKTLKVLVIILGVIGVALAAISARAAVVYVKASSPGQTLDGKTWDTAYHTVSEGITSASSGDEVWVAAGKYVGQVTMKSGVSLYGGFVGSETGREQRNWRANPTVLDGNRVANTISVPSGVPASTVIDGFTITGSAHCGSVTAVNGIYCDGSSPTITNNIISDNGSAIYVNNGSPLILCNEIRSNFRTAIYGYNYQGTIANNIIADSQAGGISLSCVGAKIINNTIVGNGVVGLPEPGLVVSGSQLTISNNIIAFNAKGVTVSRLAPLVPFTYSANCVYGNTGGDYVNWGDATGSYGNIKVNPKFSSGTYDVHLQSGSPCIGRGVNTVLGVGWTDIDGAVRIYPNAGIVDIGADEFDGTLYQYAARPTIDPNGGEFCGSATVRLICITPGAKIHYTTNNAEPTASDPYLLSGQTVTLKASCTLKARAFATGLLTDQSVCAEFVIAEKLPSPTFSPAGGYYESGQYVKLACAMSGASIYYTTDGSDPVIKGGRLYYTGIPIKANTTIRAYAWKTGWKNSDVSSASYEVRPPATLRVNQRAQGSVHDGLSWDTAFLSLEDAISASVYGDEIWVAAGEYVSATLGRDQSIYGGFKGDETERSQRDFVRNKTTITLGAWLSSTATEATIIDGFIIRGTVRGGEGASGVVSNCILRGGQGFEAAGNGRFDLINDLIIGNFCEGEGSAIRTNNALVVVSNCTVVGNASTGGSSVYAYGGFVWLFNSIVAFNSGGFRSSCGSISLDHCCVYGNRVWDFDRYMQSPIGERGNISVDPMFVDLVHGDLRLQPTSPCVDSSAPGPDFVIEPGSVDICGQPRRQGAAIDLGACESDGLVKTSTARIIRISPTGSDSNDGSSWDAPMLTIQAAANAAVVDGGQIWAKAGIYAERANLGPFVGLYGGFAGNESERSQRNAKANLTIIDAGKLGTALTLKNTCDSSAIDGFTITNGYQTSDGAGAGISCTYSSPVISGNIFTGNYAKFNGACVYSRYGSPTIKGNVMADNSSQYGSVFIHDGASAVIANNILIRNTGVGTGGIATYNSTSTVINNTLVGNTGYAIQSSGPFDKLTLANNIVAFNNSGISATESTVYDHNCIYGNLVTDCYPTSPIGTNGNISADPLFANRDSGDYHLLPGSPCIDAANPAGAPSVDFAGSVRPIDGDDNGTTLPDIGCHEFSVANAVKLNQTKAKADGERVALISPIVTGAFGDHFYVESSDRISGIMVIGVAPEAGTCVSVTGLMDTVEGERLIRSESITKGAKVAVPAPWLMNLNGIGGGPLGLQAGVSDWRFIEEPGIDGKPVRVRKLTAQGGANNIGLLIKTAAKVVCVDDGCFYIDGVAGFDDGREDIKGVRVLRLPWISYAPRVGDTVVVTGISSCFVLEDASGRIARLIKPTSIEVAHP